MSVNDAQVQQLIVLEVGEVWQPPAAPGGQPVPLLATNIALIWDSFAAKASIAPRLQELYTKRRCIEIVRSTLANLVDFSVANDYRSNQGQRFTHLTTMYTDCQAEILKVETLALGSRAPVIGTMTNTAPEPAPTSLPLTTVVDGNDPRYRGDLYLPSVSGGLR